MGRIEVRSGFTPSHLKQVSTLSRWGKSWTPIRPVTDRHSLFASSSAPCTVALACARVATPCGVAMHGVYLVSQGARTGGSQPMGLGMFYPPHVQWERIAVDDTRFQTCCLLAVAPRMAGKQALATYLSRRFWRTFTCVSRTLYPGIPWASCSLCWPPLQAVYAREAQDV